MRRAVYLLLALLLASPSFAQTCQTGFSSVQASKIMDLTGSLLASGTLTITGVDAHRNIINFSAPGGGVVMKVAKKAPVSNGAIIGTLCVPRSDLASVYVRYHIVVTDNSSSGTYAVVVDANDIPITADVFSLDAYSYPADAYANNTNVFTSGTVTGDLHVSGTLYAGTVEGATAANATHAISADTATNANHANTADSATSATSASSATTATTAGHASTADSATTASTASALAATPPDCGTEAITGINADGSPKSCVAAGSGGVLPVGDQYELQTKSSASALGGSGVLSNGSLVTSTIPFVAKQTNGTANPDLSATGSGNNGIANILAGYCVTAGCFFQRSIASIDTEDITSALNSGAPQYVHGIDNLFGADHAYFKNAGATNTGSRDSRLTVCLEDDSPTNPYTKENCESRYNIMATPGTYTFGSPMGSHSIQDNLWTYGRSISSLSGASIYAYHTGDAFDAYHYFFFRGGCLVGNDECVKGMDEQLTESPAPYGVIVTGGQGATTVKSNFTSNNGNQGDGYFLVDTSQVLASGLMLSTTHVAFPTLNTMTTSDTHAVSTAWGTLAANCGSQTTRNAPASATCSINVTSGTFSAAPGSTVYFPDPAGAEQAKVTAVGSGTITVLLAYNHYAGLPIYQGGLAGGVVAVGKGLTDPSSTHKITSYVVAGSRTATSFDYLVQDKGGELGNAIIQIPQLAPLAMTGLSRTANVVTAKVPASSYPYNNLVAPGASSLVVSGATPTDFNGTITPSVAIDSKNLIVTYNQTGPDETAPSATLTLANYNNYVIYAAAETVAPPKVTLQSDNTPYLDGTLQLEANTARWTPGDAVIQPNASVQSVIITDYSAAGDTAPLDNGNAGAVLTLSGDQWSGGVPYQIHTNDTIGMFVGYGGFRAPRSVLDSRDFWTNGFSFIYPPLNGGYLFSMGCPPEGCGPNNQDYQLYSLGGYLGQGFFNFSPSTSTFYMNNPFYAKTVAGRIAIGINGQNGLAATPAGTAAFGGWLEGIGDSSLSSSRMNLCVGNGDIGNCDGTIGATNSYAATVTAGVKPVTTFSIFQSGTPGTTTYTYACVVRTANGTTQATTATTNTGSATLSATNYNHVKCFGVPGGSTIDVYRTAGGATQGKIGSEANSAENMNIPFNDTGLAGDGTSPPTANTTGKIVDYGVADGCATFTTGVLGSTGTACGSGSSFITSITTTGTSGAATVSGGVLNIPQYAGGGSMTWPAAPGIAVYAGSNAWGTSKAAPTGALVGDSDTQTVTNKTLDGVSPATMAFVDPTSSIQTQMNAKAPLASPALTGTPTAPTATVGNNSTQIATTAFVLANASTYTLPQATNSVLGGVKCDGTSITCTAGVISSVAPSVFWSVQPGIGDGLNAIAASTYPPTLYYNDTGKTITITGIKCFTDNSGTSTLNIANGAGTALLTTPVTCSSSFAAGTQSATTTLAAGDYLKFTFVADGASKQATFVVTGNHP